MTAYSGLLAFIDLLFNLLLGITFLFVIAFLLINPPDKTGQIDPPVKLMVEMDWSPDSIVDIDLWARGHNSVWVGFTNLDGKYFTLDRDDRGTVNDIFIVDGVQHVVKRNYEVVNFTVLPPGEYFINVYYFSHSGVTEEINITMTEIDPHKMIFSSTFTLDASQERTVVSFIVSPKGVVENMRTDIQIPWAARARGGPSLGPNGGSQ